MRPAVPFTSLGARTQCTPQCSYRRRKNTIRWFENGQALHSQTGIENRIRDVWTTNRGRLTSHPPGPIGGTAIARPKHLAERSAGDPLDISDIGEARRRRTQ